MESAAVQADGTYWYFAIASMMNPRGITNRNVHPIESKPAELIDHKIYFFGGFGYAEAIPEKDSSFHGVLHRLDKESMERLDLVEGKGY